ncbi:hypothetical protein [Paenibacillus sp. FSL L8-0709]|uniref:hypothetical protein n=1 Tax=Paenibacillus sp. FSL L8-0709 TaxID=2975312 RepID=UPI0030F77616
MKWDTFHEEIRKSEITDSIAKEKEGAMVPLLQAFIVNVYCRRRFSHVDFSSFTYDQAKLAFQEGMLLTTADYEYEAEANRDNLIAQIAKITSLKKVLKNLPSSTSKKKRFV